MQKLIQSYGRKRCRGLSDSQEYALTELYKKYGIAIKKNQSDLQDAINITKIDPREWFDCKFEHIVVEIGFGRGEHLINNAINNPNIGFIGCEPFENGIASCLSSIEENKLENVRVYNGDARVLLDLIQDQTLSRVYVLFPDPWRKSKHCKRRLLSVEFMKFIHEKLTCTGLLYIATDSDHYIQMIIENFLQLSSQFKCNTDINHISVRPLCFLGTRYEQKAIAKAKVCYYVRGYKQVQQNIA